MLSIPLIQFIEPFYANQFRNLAIIFSLGLNLSHFSALIDIEYETIQNK